MLFGDSYEFFRKFSFVANRVLICEQQKISLKHTRNFIPSVLENEMHTRPYRSPKAFVIDRLLDEWAAAGIAEPDGYQVADWDFILLVTPDNATEIYLFADAILRKSISNKKLKETN